MELQSFFYVISLILELDTPIGFPPTKMIMVDEPNV
jgi:hypothetical protein